MKGRMELISEYFSCEHCNFYSVYCDGSENGWIILPDGELCYHLDARPYMKGLEEKIVVIPSSQGMSPDELYLKSAWGFITQPTFLDNGFVASQGEKALLKRFYTQLDKFNHEVMFAVVPDNMMKVGKELAQKYPHINWIYPLHRFAEVQEAVECFSFLGFPHRKKWRDYSLKQFLQVVPYEQRWYLGFFNEKRPYILLEFRGFDSTLPTFYSGRLGKLWKNWNEAVSVPKPEEPRVALEHANLFNFSRALAKLFNQQTLG